MTEKDSPKPIYPQGYILNSTQGADAAHNSLKQGFLVFFFFFQPQIYQEWDTISEQEIAGIYLKIPLVSHYISDFSRQYL